MRPVTSHRRSRAEAGGLLAAALGLSLAFIAVVAPSGWAQPGQEAVLAGQIELPRLVDLAAERLKLNIEYDAAVLKGNVTLRLGAGVSDEELWALTNRVLASRGFTTLRGAGGGSDVISVVRTDAAAGLSGLGDGGVDGAGASEGPALGYQSVVVRLQHSTATDIAEAVGKVLSKPGGSVTALGGDLVLVSDLAPRVEQALEVVSLLDTPPGELVVTEIPLANVGALQLATLVAQVSAKRELVSGEKTPGEVVPSAGGSSVLLVAPHNKVEYWRGLIASLDQRERVETVTYSATAFPPQEVGGLIEQAARGGGPPDDRWRLVVDDLTGTLIVTATPTQHEAVRALLDRLASAPQAARRPVRSFVIRNRNVRELAEVVQRLLESGVLSEGGGAEAERGAGVRPIESVVPPTLPPVGSIVAPGGSPTEETPPESRPLPQPPSRRGGAGEAAEPPLVLSIDEGTSTLIAMGEPRLLDELAALIAQLDVRQSQVMLEVLMVSLSEAQTLNLGVELEALDLSGDTLWRLASLFGLSARGPNGAPNPTAAGTGLTGVVLNPGDFSVVLRALKTINDGRSLSMPKMLVGNNQQATLDSILEQPFLSTNASNTVATTSFGGSSVAGTQVSIKPQIAEGDHLILSYQIALSSFTGPPSVPELPPAKQTNKVASVATIPDGFTVVVGGIDLTNDSKSVSQVPLVARIPLVGEAFKNRAKASNRTRFYVFIRANVLRARGFEDLRYLSATATEAANVDDGFPELEPRVIR